MYRYNGIAIILFILVILVIISVGVAVVVRKDKVETGEMDSNGIINVQDAILKRTYYSDFYEIKITTVIYKDGTLMQSRIKWTGENNETPKENFKVMKTLSLETMSQINTAIEKVKSTKLTSNYSAKDYGIEIKENQEDTQFINIKPYSQSTINELNDLINSIIPNYDLQIQLY